MRRKNQNINSNSFSNLNLSFKTGNLLQPPCDMKTFMEQTKVVQEQRKRQNAVSMLNKSPHFIKKQRESGEINSDSDIENVPSEFKRQKEIQLHGFVNGRKKETILKEYRVGVEFSQLSQLQDEEIYTKVEYDYNQINYLNPQKSKYKNSNPIKNVFEGHRRSQYSDQNKRNTYSNKKETQQPPSSSEYSDDSQLDIPVNPLFLAFLQKQEQRKTNNQPSRN